MVPVCGWVGRVAGAGRLAALVLAALAPSAGHAQDLDCNQLYAAIQAADGAGAQPNRWDRAARQQRREIERTQRYSDQLNCGSVGGLFGGEPPQCGPVTERLRRMQENLASMEAQADLAPTGGDPSRRGALVARYNQTCVGGNAARVVDLGRDVDRDLGRDLGPLPDDGRPPADMLDPDGLTAVPPGGDIMEGSGEPRARLGQAICVRTCDGGYFPLGPHATQDQLGGLEQLCQASCPNTEAKLYTMGRGDDLASATAVDGTSYTALPAAFRFEKTFAPTCTCKPPNQSWVQALAQAETMLGNTDRRDITVTASLSDQMARPGAGPALASKPTKAQRAAAAAAARATPDLTITRDAEKGLQAPTASTATTGIGGPFQAERIVREGEGPTVAVAGPDGVRKRIRLIVP